MAKYTSKYKSLGFYVNGEHKSFSNGFYETNDAEEMAVLERVSDAIKQDEAVSPKATKQTEAKPASKVPARKPSAK